MLLEAVAPYVIVPATWHLVDVAPRVKAKLLTVGVMVTVCVVVIGPLQPAALAVITEVPLHPAAKVTAPVLATMAFPPVILVASKV